MEFKQVEALYYQFSLKESFIPKTINAELANKKMAIGYATRQLNYFIKKKIIFYKIKIMNKKCTTDVHYNHITLITKSKKEYSQVKDFCNYLMSSGELLDLTIKCFIDEQIKFTDFEAGLNMSYKTYEYLKFAKEIPINEAVDKKKLKI
jgi:hypothetical protein